jgi:predicted ATP-binding protein involved in virulence
MAELKINNDITTEKRKIVIIGKNGSGKSVLLGKLRQQYHDTSIFIPSARSVHNLNTNLREINSMENRQLSTPMVGVMYIILIHYLYQNYSLRTIMKCMRADETKRLLTKITYCY